MKIFTGRKNASHVTAETFRAFAMSMFGSGSAILPVWEKFAYVLESNNSILIKRGMMIHHGNISLISEKTGDKITIQNGTQGMKRIDLIVNRYKKEELTGVESNEWVYIKGTPSTADPQTPSYTKGDLMDGATIDDCPVYSVHLDGLNVSKVELMIPVMKIYPDLFGELSTKMGTDYAVDKEIMTNDTYNGKPVYLKIVPITSLPNNATTAYNTGIQGATNIWIDEGLSYLELSKGNCSLPYVDTSGYFIRAIVNRTSFNIEITDNWNYSQFSAKIALKYTK